MKYQIKKSVAALFGITFLAFGLLLGGFSANFSTAGAVSPALGQGPLGKVSESFNIDERIFPANYPEFLKQAYHIARQIEKLEQFNPEAGNAFLKSRSEGFQTLFRDTLASEKLNIRQLCDLARSRSGGEAFETFLKLFGINDKNEKDIELEVLAQIKRISRSETFYGFVQEFDNEPHNTVKRVTLVESSTKPRELEYALRHCSDEEFQTLRDTILAREDFGPKTPQDQDLFDYLESSRLRAFRRGDKPSALKWQSVIAQLISQRAGSDHSRLPFTKWELFAMMRNAERTLEQRRRPFLDVTDIELLDKESAAFALEMIETPGRDTVVDQNQGIMAYGFLDSRLATELRKLRQTYEDILHNKGSGQGEKTKKSVQLKKALLEHLELGPSKSLDLNHRATPVKLRELAEKILEGLNEPYRLPFIRGIILLRGDEGNLVCRFIEDFPMIVAGETYPYQWKHDNEVNIALLLANVDPYDAAQAVRFIIYYGMWRSERAKEIGLYGWLSQTIFGDRQTGKLPAFNNRIYYYFPDFRFRPTRDIDGENERNRTSEIMQLPFFGWTVWRVYEEMKRVNEKHSLAFLMEVYPYVRANTEAIRTALDPYDERVLSGRDAWVNWMDNAWYHLMVMARHLPERLIPRWSFEILDKHRVDNRIDKRPGNPVDPKLVGGRPSDYYYAFKTVFYDVINELGLEPERVYHATPYNAKDVAITSVMARSLEAQIAMAKVLKDNRADIHGLSALRNRKDEIVKGWGEEINRYQTYLDRMKRAVNLHLWSPDDYQYYNRDVTQMFPSLIEQQFCYVTLDRQNQVSYRPRMEYWDLESEKEPEKGYVLSKKARDSMLIDDRYVAVWMDSKNMIRFDYRDQPNYWSVLKDENGKSAYRLNVDPHDPFIVEQFCRVKKGESGSVRYEPDMRYWNWIEDDKGNGRYELNQRAKTLLGKGARSIEDGDLLASPAIATFFPLFGHIPSPEQAFQLAVQVVNPWTWWPENGIPIPTQPMMIKSVNGRYIPNDVYDPNKYWRGPTWMSSTKPVIDGFNSYGYEMLYLYLVNRSVGTLRDGRAVEHWNPETGEVNTSNVNFPWAASCMAGSIWSELTDEQRTEYLRLARTPRYAETDPGLAIKFFEVPKGGILQSGTSERARSQ